MPLVLLADAEGCQVWSGSAAGARELPGRSVSFLKAAAEGACLAVLDDHEVWRRDATGTWVHAGTSPIPLQSLVATAAGKILGGGRDEAAVVGLAPGQPAERLTGFDRVPGRAAWFAGGPPLGVRSLAALGDGGTVLAGVHVGGVPRSENGGATWLPTLPVAWDVHELDVHPTRTNLVAAAAAVGLCVSADGGRTWELLVEGLGAGSALAVAFLDDRALFSFQDGPFAAQSRLWCWRLAGRQLEPVGDGLPAALEGRVDTAMISTRGGAAALADGGGSVWVRPSAGDRWERIAARVAGVRGLALL